MAAGSALARRMSCHPREGHALAEPQLGSLGPVAHAMSPTGVRGACKHWLADTGDMAETGPASLAH